MTYGSAANRSGFSSPMPQHYGYLPQPCPERHTLSGELRPLGAGTVRGAEMKQFMPFPDSNRAPLAGQHFQVAVIGGGIMGVAIARECARAGKRTLLVDQH